MAFSWHTLIHDFIDKIIISLNKFFRNTNRITCNYLSIFSSNFPLLIWYVDLYIIFSVCTFRIHIIIVIWSVYLKKSLAVSYHQAARILTATVFNYLDLDLWENEINPTNKIKKNKKNYFPMIFKETGKSIWSYVRSYDPTSGNRPGYDDKFTSASWVRR